MASITKRIRKDGSIVYRAEIKIKKQGKIVHRESKTFSKQKTARDWGLRRESELQDQSVYKRAQYIAIDKLIEMYIEKFNPTKLKRYQLTRISAYDIAKIDAQGLKTSHLVEHIQWRNETCHPSTASRDLVYLSGVLKTMSGALELGLDLSCIDHAKKILSREGLIRGSNKRDRTFTTRELWQLSRYLDEKTRACMWFALYSSRRISEITSIKWCDIDHEDRTVVVRNLKHPRRRNLSKKAKLPKPAYKLIMKQPKIDERIFPYNPKTMSVNFIRACKSLNIKDLRLHDTRHHAMTHLAMQGLTLPELQLVSLHDGYSSLQRYINLKPENLDI